MVQIYCRGLRFQPGANFPLRFPASLRGVPTQGSQVASGPGAASRAAANSPEEEPNQNPARQRGLGFLGVWSYLAWAVCWASVLLAMIACMAIGSGKIGNWPVSAKQQQDKSVGVAEGALERNQWQADELDITVHALVVCWPAVSVNSLE